VLKLDSNYFTRGPLLQNHFCDEQHRAMLKKVSRPQWRQLSLGRKRRATSLFKRNQDSRQGSCKYLLQKRYQRHLLRQTLRKQRLNARRKAHKVREGVLPTFLRGLTRSLIKCTLKSVSPTGVRSSSMTPHLLLRNRMLANTLDPWNIDDLAQYTIQYISAQLWRVLWRGATWSYLTMPRSLCWLNSTHCVKRDHYGSLRLYIWFSRDTVATEYLWCNWNANRS
jgi:hypothetical protein